MATGDTLIPGTGFVGDLTANPVGSLTATVMLRWTAFPFMPVAGTLAVGVIAEHASGMNRVEFHLDGGTPVIASTRVENPDTGEVSYYATLDAAQYATDAIVEVRAVGFPNDGVPRILQGDPFDETTRNEDRSLWVPIDKGGLRNDVMYVDRVNGDDATGDGTLLNPYQSIAKAIRALNDTPGVEPFGATVYLLDGDYEAWGPGTATEPRMRATGGAPCAGASTPSRRGRLGASPWRRS